MWLNKKKRNVPNVKAVLGSLLSGKKKRKMKNIWFINILYIFMCVCICMCVYLFAWYRMQ